MIAIVGLWIAAPALGIALILQWTVLRRKHQNELTKQHARFAQQQQMMSLHIQQAQRQIRQLRHDLAAARLQVKRTTMVAGAPAQSESPAHAALQRTLDEASQERRHLPTDGFADTRPFRHSEHDRGVLLR